MVQVPNPSGTMIFGKNWHSTGGAWMWSLYSIKGAFPGGKGLLDWDADEDGVLDSSFAIYSDPVQIRHQEVYGGPGAIYNNLAAIHPRRTGDLVFLDGHGETLPISYIMARPQDNDDLWGSKVFDKPWYQGKDAPAESDR